MNWITAIKNIGTFKNAMEAGQQVADPESWKQIGLTASKLGIIFMAISAALTVFGIDVPVIDEKTMALVTTGLATLLLGVSNVVALVTSRKIGTKPNATAVQVIAAVINPATPVKEAAL